MTDSARGSGRTTLMLCQAMRHIRADGRAVVICHNRVGVDYARNIWRDLFGRPDGTLVHFTTPMDIDARLHSVSPGIWRERGGRKDWVAFYDHYTQEAALMQLDARYKDLEDERQRVLAWRTK